MNQRMAQRLERLGAQMRAKAEAQPADYPESLPGWRDYRR